MDNILIATVDENWNQFESIGGVFKFVSVVPEYNNKIELMSGDSNFFVDYDGYASLGYMNYPLRPTRVFLKDGEELEENCHCVSSPYNDLDNAIRQNNNKNIFFLGSPEFVGAVIPHITRISICVVAHEESQQHPRIQFPIEMMKDYFLGRVDSEPKMLESINKLKELGGLDENDKLFMCPSKYAFIEYSRANNSVVSTTSNELRALIFNFLSSFQPPRMKTLIFENDTLIVFGELEHGRKMDSYNRNLKLTFQEKMTRYKKGDDFQNNKNDIVSYTEWDFSDFDFLYKSTNGQMCFKFIEEFDEYINKLKSSHISTENIWSIKL